MKAKWTEIAFRVAPSGTVLESPGVGPRFGSTQKLVRPLRWVVVGIVGAFAVVLAGWLATPPFAALKATSHVNARAKAAHDDPRFSVRIRDGLPRMAPTTAGQGVTR